jgi:hypothetical protein
MIRYEKIESKADYISYLKLSASWGYVPKQEIKPEEVSEKKEEKKVEEKKEEKKVEEKKEEKKTEIKKSEIKKEELKKPIKKVTDDDIDSILLDSKKNEVIDANNLVKIKDGKTGGWMKNETNSIVEKKEEEEEEIEEEEFEKDEGFKKRSFIWKAIEWLVTIGVPLGFGYFSYQKFKIQRSD